jgi:DNA-binding IclR family transcriptional regulator
MLGSVERTGRALERPEWGVSEAAAALQLPKSGAHALLGSLAEVGLLQRTPRSRYRLGWRIVALNHTLVTTTAFRDGAHRRMRRVAERFGKTLHLAVLEGPDVVYLDKVDGPRAAPIAESGVGVRMAAHCTAVGKVLLAAADDERVDATLEQRGLARRTPHTITSRADLGAALQAVRARGFALDLQETVPDLCCVALPITDAHGTVQAAMSISVPTLQFRRAPGRYRQIIEDTATAVSCELGHLGATTSP